MPAIATGIEVCAPPLPTPLPAPQHATARDDARDAGHHHLLRRRLRRAQAIAELAEAVPADALDRLVGGQHAAVIAAHRDLRDVLERSETLAAARVEQLAVVVEAPAPHAVLAIDAASVLVRRRHLHERGHERRAYRGRSIDLGAITDAAVLIRPPAAHRAISGDRGHVAIADRDGGDPGQPCDRRRHSAARRRAVAELPVAVRAPAVLRAVAADLAGRLTARRHRLRAL